ncbi:MAG: hypothetical protein IPO91_34675 [Chloroflexi bacterium]|nr:hypothetical protein [Chloroflexota bacterium]
MMGIDGGRRLFENEASKAGNVSSTLRRFGGYFRRNWFGVVIALVLVVTATGRRSRHQTTSGRQSIATCSPVPRSPSPGRKSVDRTLV